MIEAQRPNGEMWRPTRANQRARCWICGGDLESAQVRRRTYAWAHAGDRLCRPRDSFMLGLANQLPQDGPVALLFADGPSPSPDIAEREAAEKRFMFWIVDGRHAVSDHGRSYPKANPPSYLAMAAWSEFAECWFARPFPVFIALDDYLQGETERPVFFRVESLWEYEAERKGGNLRGVNCCFAKGRLFTLEGIVRAATIPGSTPAVHPLDTYPY